MRESALIERLKARKSSEKRCLTRNAKSMTYDVNCLRNKIEEKSTLTIED